jgi:hypothetical protein
MGEETKVLSNESIDVPSHENFLTPVLIIRQSDEPNNKFSIKLNFGGVELKGNSGKEKYIYETTCYRRRCCSCWEMPSSCICHIKKYIISTASNKFRVKFDNDTPLIFDNHTSGVSSITFSNEFIEQMKGKKMMTIEIEDVENGKLWYDFNIDGIESICEENNVYKFRIPPQKTIDDTTDYKVLTKGTTNITSYIILTIVFVCFVIWLISLYNEKPYVTNLPLQESKDTITTNQPLSANLVDLSITNKKEKSKIKPKPNYEIEIKETKEEVSEIKTQSEFVQPINDVILSKEDNVTPTKEEPIQIINSLNVNDYPTYKVKKKGILTRLFSKN